MNNSNELSTSIKPTNKRKTDETITKQSFISLYASHKGKVTDKWSLYLSEWDRILPELSDREMNILEIGIQNGGSLEIWAKYFSSAKKIIGCDIDPICGKLKFEEPNIDIIVGDINSQITYQKLIQEASSFGLIIDDGSHTSEDIIRSFFLYFPHLDDGGIYIIEDIHCSYWQEFGGGLFNPYSALSFFKRLCDIINFEHWRTGTKKSEFLRQFIEKYDLDIIDLDLEHIHSIEVINSMCIIRKESSEKNFLNKRICVGNEELVTNNLRNNVDHEFIHDLKTVVQDDSCLDIFKVIEKNFALDEQQLIAQNQLSKFLSELNISDETFQSENDFVTKTEKTINSIGQVIQEKDVHIHNIENALELKEKTIQEKDVHIHNIENALELKEKTIQEKEICIHNGEILLNQKNKTIQNKESIIDNLNCKIEQINANLSISERQTNFYRVQIQNLLSSRTWRVGSFFGKPFTKLFPFGSHRRLVLARIYRKLLNKPHVEQTANFQPDIKNENQNSIKSNNKNSPINTITIHPVVKDPYAEWIQNNEPSEFILARQRKTSEVFQKKPIISIVTPVFNTPLTILREMIESVIAQSYPYWELCIANGSPENEMVNKILSEFQDKDSRIKIVQLPENFGIAKNTNAAIELAIGEYIAFLDHDDLIAPFALFSIAETINKHGEADILYSDEDKITEDSSTRFSPFFKPTFSPDYLRTNNYICHFLIVQKELGNEIGWIRSGFEGAQDFDFVLRASEKATKIVHIPQILYHWRAIPGSTAATTDAKEYATASGLKAVQEHIERKNINATVSVGPVPTSYRVNFQIIENLMVSIIIPNHNHADDLEKCIQSILQKTTYKNFEILIIENNSSDPEIFHLYEKFKKTDNIRILEFNESFNFSKINNFAAIHSNGEYLLFLNNDTEVISPDWIEQMLQFAQRKEIGIVGAKLYYPNDTIQHAGVILGHGGIAGHAYLNEPRNSFGLGLSLKVPRNVSAITAACMMTRKKVFFEIGGFDLNYILAFGDVDICLKSIVAGYLNIWTPYAELYHYESKTRGYEDTPEKLTRFHKEINYFRQNWIEELSDVDEYYNPNYKKIGATNEIEQNFVRKSCRIKRISLMSKDRFDHGV